MHLTDLIRLALITIRALVTPFKNRSLGKFTLLCFDRGRGGSGGGGGVIGVWGGVIGVRRGSGEVAAGGGWWWCGLTGQGGWGRWWSPERLPTTSFEGSLLVPACFATPKCGI